MFRINKSDVPKPIYTLFRKKNSYYSYNTRRSNNLHTSVGRTEAIYKTFSFYGVHIHVCEASLQKGPDVAMYQSRETRSPFIINPTWNLEGK